MLQVLALVFLYQRGPGGGEGLTDEYIIYMAIKILQQIGYQPGVWVPILLLVGVS